MTTPTWTIAKREFGAFFKSPVAYVVLGAFVPIVGYLFFSSFFLIGNASMESFFGNMPFLLLFFCPAIAMRLLAEERGSGTIEMLLTMPVREVEVVVGKYLAALGVLAVGLLVTLPFALTVGRLGSLDVGPVFAGYLGTLLLGGTYLAVGLASSALTKNQVVAYIVGLAVCLGLFFMGMFYSMAGSVLGPILQYASPAYQFQKITRGVIELRNVVYYVSVIGLLVVLSVQVLESRKWR
jgi:ABC-2 type transport system permease protein